MHPKLAQTELRDFAAENKIKIQAWSPLMQGQLLDHPLIVELAQKYGQSPAQIILRWDVQQEILLVVKSIHQERMKNNAAIFDFNIELEDIEKLNQLDEGLRSGPDPMTFDF